MGLSHKGWFAIIGGMMYSSFPSRDQKLIKTALVVAWGFVALGGAAGVLLPPEMVASFIGPIYPRIGAALVLLAAAVATLGVMKKYWWLEWIFAWPANAGMSVYLFSLWGLVFEGNHTMLQHASNMTALMMFTTYRIVACSAHARKLRSINKQVQRIQTQLQEKSDAAE